MNRPSFPFPPKPSDPGQAVLFAPVVLGISLFGILILLSACESVRQASEVGVVTPGSLDRRVYGEYWEIEGLDGPVRDDGVRTVAITEFTVAFVTEKIRHQPDKLGLMKREMRYEQRLFEELPQQLYEVFADRVRSLGTNNQVIPRETVMRSPAFARLESSPPAGFPIFRYITPKNLDNGKVRTVWIYTPPGFKFLTGEPETIAQTEETLLAEVDADLAIRARFFLSVHRARATVDQGSEIYLTGKDRRGKLTSKRTLSTDSSVQVGGNYQPTVTGVYEIDTDRYLHEINGLFLTYIDLAVEAIRSR